jgi:hypothetical protein
MNRTALLAAGVALALGLTAAASTWTKSYGHGRDALGHGVLALADGGALVVGEIATGNSEADTRLLLLSLDADGNVIWEKIYGACPSSGAAVVATGDGGWLVAGTSASADGDDADVLLAAFDATGNELWSRTYGTPLDEYGVDLTRLSDGAYAVVANSIDPNDVIADPGAAGYAGAEGRSNVYALRTDAAGNELWSYASRDGRNILVAGCAAAADGGFVVLECVLRYPLDDNDIAFVKLDATGSLIWERLWDEGDASAYDLCSTNDGGFLISGAYRVPGSPALTTGDALLIRVDGEGNELWMSTYGRADRVDTAHLVVELSDRRIVTVGSQARSLSGFGDDIYIATLAPNGTLLGETSTATSAHNMHKGLAQAPDGTLAAVGTLAQAGRPFRVQVIRTEVPG